MAILITEKGEKIMEMLEKKELAIEFMNELEESQLIDLHNTHCDNCNHEETIYCNDEQTIDEMVGVDGKSAWDILDAFCLDSYSTSDEYFYWTIYGIVSTSCPKEDVIEISEIVDEFFSSDYCDDEFKDFVIEKLKDAGYSEEFIKWFEDEEPDWDDWEDTEDLQELYEDYLEENAEDEEDDESEKEDEQ